MRQRHFLVLLAPALLLILLLAPACNDSTEPEEPDNEVIENDNSPNANDLITIQAVFGDSDMKSSLWHIDGDPTGGYACTGTLDHVVGARLVSATGAILWDRDIIFQPRNVLSLDSDRFTGTMVVGAYDPNGDDDMDQGAASLITSSGSVADQIFFQDQTYPVWFNSAKAVSDSLILCVGGATVDEVSFPLLCTLLLDDEAKLQVLDYEIIEALPGGSFADMEARGAVEMMEAGQITQEFYVNGQEFSGAVSRLRVNAMRVPIHDLASTEVLWTSFVVGYEGLNASLTTGHTLSRGTNGKVYLSGSTEVNKEPNPSSGGYWRAGLVACLSSTGDVEWTNRVILSGFSEYYYDLVASSDGVYAVGRYSYYSRGDRNFGYGILTRFDLATGNLDYHLTVGNPQCRSSLYGLKIDGTTATAVGSTNAFEDGSYQGWFVNLDLSSPPDALLQMNPGGMKLLGAQEPGDARGSERP